MQQPSSQFYHLVYGAKGMMFTNDKKYFLHLDYTMRDAYRQNGFELGENARTALVGLKLADIPGFSIFSHLGYGQVLGYVKRIRPLKDKVDYREFSLKGPSMGVSIQYSGENLIFFAEYQMLVGIVNSQEMNSKVAWPYSFIRISGGYVF